MEPIFTSREEFLSGNKREASVLNSPVKRLRRTPSALNLLQPFAGQTLAGQRHENDVAEIVLVCEPDLPKMMGSLHPCGSLYERPINLDEAKAQHQAFQQVLSKHGARVVTIRDVLSHGAESNVKDRIDLEDLASRCLKYELHSDCEERLLSASDRFYLGDTYKGQVLEALSIEQLVNIVLTNPTVTVQPSFRDTGFTATYNFNPLTNLIYTRDQQITTRKGIVACRLRSEQRQSEAAIMAFCLKKIGMDLIGGIDEPGYLEGGDFFPAGEDLCLIGIGLRSNFEAVQQCMDNDYLGTRRVAVVKDDFDKSQDRMHLDCVFSILSEDCVLMLEDMMGADSPKRRMVDEYTVNRKGIYVRTKEDVEFSQYMRDNGYNIIPIPPQFQLEYGCNVLNMGNSNIISCHKESARLIARSPHFHGNVEFLHFRAITSMYGALHCSSQVLRRKPPGC
eukprot:jgi/Mesvir1/9426/Mv02169-RA.1